MTVRKIEIRDVLKKKRVAAYARVSTLKDAQEDSFETQVNYYDTLIKSNPDWSLVKIYSDNGFSGVSAEERPGFMEMIKDAEYKGFDILLVRSVSRFARNLMEAQLYCRKLKIFGVDVRFERERISINDPSADMAFGLLAACAQEESRSISERTKWGIHNLQAQGVLHIGNKALGYDEKDGVLVRAFLKPGETKREEKYVELASIGVDPNVKSKGVGSQLIDALKAQVDFSEYAYITLETDAVNNEGANHFYEKNGFVLEREFETNEGRKMFEYRYRR